MVRKLDGDTDFVDIVGSFAKRYIRTIAVYILPRQRVLRTSIDLIKENGFTLKQSRNRRYPTESMTDADYTADQRFFTNIPAQAEYLQYTPEQTIGDIGLYLNTNKIEFMYFKQKCITSILMVKSVISSTVSIPR